MNRSKKLMAGVIILVLLSVGTSELTLAHRKALPLPGNPFVQPDPTETAIQNLLRDVPKQKAMTLNEILTRRPDLERSKAQAAIKKLLGKKIWQTGDGSRYRPIRYYGQRSGVGR
jgi:hypothetical protein